MWLFLVLILGLQSRIQEQFVDDRDRNWLHEIDLYDDETEVGDLYSFEFDDKEEPVSESSEEEVVIGAPNAADELEIGSTFLSTFIDGLHLDMSSDDEEALGADMPDYLFKIEDDVEDDKEEESDSEEDEVSARENPFPAEAENALLDYLFGSKDELDKELDKQLSVDLDDDEGEVAVGSSSDSDDSDVDNLLDYFQSDSFENKVSQDTDEDDNDEDDDDGSLDGLKNMATDLQGERKKKQLKEEAKEDKEDAKEDKKKKKAVKKAMSPPKKKLSVVEKLSKLKSIMKAKASKEPQSERAKLQRNVHLSKHPEIVKAMTKLQYSMGKKKLVESEPKPKGKPKGNAPVLLVNAQEIQGVKKGESPPPLSKGPSKPRPIDPNVFKEIEALEKRMVDGVSGAELQQLKADVSRLIQREKGKDDIHKSGIGGLKAKMMQAMSMRKKSPPKRITPDMLQSKIDDIRETMEKGSSPGAEDVDLEAEVETLVRELGKGILSLVNTKAEAKAKVLAIDMAKKLAHKMVESQKAKVLDEVQKPSIEESPGPKKEEVAPKKPEPSIDKI